MAHRLGVNIDHVATLRQARLPKGGRTGLGIYPDPVQAAKICEKAGAHSLVMHLREDRRHVQDEDLFRVKDAVKIRLNMEMSVAASVVRVAKRLKPQQVTLVPERRKERTTESGLNLLVNELRYRRVIDDFKNKSITVSLFIDPDPRQIKQAAALGADSIEIHTGSYAEAASPGQARRELRRIREGAALGRQMGFWVHAGHGLDYKNVPAVAKIAELEEFNIGYSIITRALWVGLEKAVGEMLEAIG